MFYNTVSKQYLFYGLIYHYYYICINKIKCLMKNEFVYVLMFGEEYLCHVTGIESAIKLAKRLKKNLKEQGKPGFYDIYYLGILIAQF